MLHLLTSFNLPATISIDVFERKLDELSQFLTEIELLDEAGPVLSRYRHPVMDTDDEREHQFAFVMTFRDRDQCERALQHMYREDGPGVEAHRSLQGMIENPIFSIWEERNGSDG